MSTKRKGDAQNTAVRAALSKATTRPANPAQLRGAFIYFGGLCAYCGKPLDEHRHFDHAVPINREHQGDDSVGNRIPSCHECNAEKGGNQDFREFLADKLESCQRIAKILDYMRSHDYEPPVSGGDPKRREILERLRALVAAAILEAVGELKGLSSSTASAPAT